MSDATLTRRTLLLGTCAAAALGTFGHLAGPWRRPGAETGGPTFPRWVSSSERSAAAYRTALAMPDLLATLDCYCGCMHLDPPHASLRECFVRPDGSLEPHASGCDVCQYEALDAERWAGEGVAWAEIRRRIDLEYADHDPVNG